jgi:hypothetical protein
MRRRQSVGHHGDPSRLIDPVSHFEIVISLARTSGHILWARWLDPMERATWRLATTVVVHADERNRCRPRECDALAIGVKGVSRQRLTA